MKEIDRRVSEKIDVKLVEIVTVALILPVCVFPQYFLKFCGHCLIVTTI